MGTIQEDAPQGNLGGLPAHARGVYTRSVMWTLVLLAALLGGAACAPLIASQAVPVAFPRPATLTSEVYRPDGVGPFPAVILLHGCSGVSPNMAAWARWLRTEGYGAMILDSFSGRGLGNLCGNSAPLRGPSRAHDVFAAAAALRALPWVDGERIAVMGFSHGGWTTLWAARLAPQYPDLPIKALVTFYPFCGDQFALAGAAPLLMLLGGKDDWTAAARCQKLAEGSKWAGRDVTDVVYPDARHGFDAAHIRRPFLVWAARGGRGAVVEYNSKAHEDSEKRVRQFLEAHLKP